MRLQSKVAIVVGAGQTPGDTIGNGRATAILFARERARVALVDRNRESARETQAMIEAEGGECFVCEADIRRAEDCRAFTRASLDAYGRIDILHNNVGVNAIRPGLINTPMAIEGHMKARNIAKEDLIRERDAQVPLRGKMGTAWDVAHAALFLASDEAQFITGVVLPVDGGQSARIGG